MGQLPFICSYGKVFTFNDLSKDQSVRWATHAVIGQKPILEYIGEDLAKVSLKIRLDASLGIAPAVALLRLKRMMENKKYKTLVIGGEYFGRFVIKSLSEDRKFHSGNGVCTVAEVTISLIEHAGERTTSWTEQLSKLKSLF